MAIKPMCWAVAVATLPLMLGLVASGCAKARCEKIAEAFDDCVSDWDEDDFVEDCIDEYNDDSDCKDAIKDLAECIGDNPDCDDFEDCEHDIEDAEDECHMSPIDYVDWDDY